MSDKRYVIGIDGGGTKTACMLADLSGQELAYSVAGGSNHQTIGVFSAMENVCKSIDLACVQLGIGRESINHVFLGMAGADLPEDMDLLSTNLRAALGAIPFHLVNDSWIAFSSATECQWGAVSICGTGNNLGVKDKTGHVYSVRALRYMLGNYGGGNHLAEMALHRAFRCDEGTGPYTALTKELPAFCRCSSMDELAHRIYVSDYRYQREFNIPKLVFDLAYDGDEVSQALIENMAWEIGEMLGRLIIKAGLKHEVVPLVLSGSLYLKDQHHLFIPHIQRAVEQFVPCVKVLLAQNPPVYGALLDSLLAVGKRLPKERMEQIRIFAKQAFSA